MYFQTKNANKNHNKKTNTFFLHIQVIEYIFEAKTRHYLCDLIFNLNKKQTKTTRKIRMNENT